MPHISSNLEVSYQVESLREAAQVNPRYYDLVEQVVEARQAEYDRQLNQLLERPHEALVADFVYLHSLYADRVVEVPREDGVRERQFATRTFNETTGTYELDDRYRVLETGDGNVIYSIETRLMPDSGTEIIFDGEGIISARTIIPGYTVPMPYEHYDRASKDVLERTLATARIVNKRQQKYPQTAAYADENARDLLEIKLGL